MPPEETYSQHASHDFELVFNPLPPLTLFMGLSEG